MSVILPRLRFFVKQGLLRQLRKCKNAALRLRYLMIINIDNGRSARQTDHVPRLVEGAERLRMESH